MSKAARSWFLAFVVGGALTACVEKSPARAVAAVASPVPFTYPPFTHATCWPSTASSGFFRGHLRDGGPADHANCTQRADCKTGHDDTEGDLGGWVSLSCQDRECTCAYGRFGVETPFVSRTLDSEPCRASGDDFRRKLRALCLPAGERDAAAGGI